MPSRETTEDCRSFIKFLATNAATKKLRENDNHRSIKNMESREVLEELCFEGTAILSDN